MQPNSDQQRGGLQVPSSRGQIIPPTSRQATINLARQQVGAVYDEPQPNEVIAAQPISTRSSHATNPYHQTHDNQADAQAAEQDKAVQAHWQKYHSAWQQYYQMYYDRYYQSVVHQQLAEQSEKPAKNVETDTSVSQEQAMSQLRSELLDKVRVHGQNIRRSRHFVPVIVGLGVALSFLLVQYNQLMSATLLSFVIPASTQSQDAYTDPASDNAIHVGPEPLLNIPAINVSAPVIYGLTTLDEPVVEKKLESGVVHYPIPGANAVPGQIGNTVVLGHSANDVFVAGDFKFVFLHLDRLQKGDKFYLNYNSTRYTYAVTEKRVILPTQVSTLVLNNNKPMATLVTCVPVGTSAQRLLVIGEQIAPDPNTAAAATPSESAQQTEKIGGQTSNFFERLFH